MKVYVDLTELGGLYRSSCLLRLTCDYVVGFVNITLLCEYINHK